MAEIDYVKENEALKQDIKMTKEQISLLQTQLAESRATLDQKYSEQMKVHKETEEIAGLKPLVADIAKLETRLSQLDANLAALQQAAPENERIHDNKVDLVVSLKQQAAAVREEQQKLKRDLQSMDDLRSQIITLESQLEKMASQKPTPSTYQSTMAAFAAALKPKSQAPSTK